MNGSVTPVPLWHRMLLGQRRWLWPTTSERHNPMNVPEGKPLGVLELLRKLCKLSEAGFAVELGQNAFSVSSDGHRRILFSVQFDAESGQVEASDKLEAALLLIEQ